MGCPAGKQVCRGSWASDGQENECEPMMGSCSTLGCQQHCELNEESKARQVIFPLCSTLVRHIWVLADLGPDDKTHMELLATALQNHKDDEGMEPLSYEERLTVPGLFSLESTVLRGFLSMCIKYLMGRYTDWRQTSRLLKYTKFYLNSFSYKWSDTATDCSAR